MIQIIKKYAAALIALMCVTSVSAQVAELGGTMYGTLEAAIADATDGQIIKLQQDIDQTATGVKIDRDIILDLNGHNIKAGESRTTDILVTKKLTLRDSSTGANGKIYTETPYSTTNRDGVVRVEGGEFIMESGNIEAVIESDPENKGQFGIVAWGNAKVTINGGTVKAGWYTIASNGTDEGDLSFIVNGGELISTTDYSIYAPAKNGKVVINDGVVYGKAGGIAMNAGNLVVNGGTITSKGQGSTGTWGDGTGGMDNAAIIVNAAYGDAKAEINDGKIIAEGNAVVLKTGTAHNGTIAVSGGIFSSNVPAEYLVPGAKMAENPDGTWGLTQVATIGTKEYGTFAQAVAAAQNGETVKLVADADIYEQIEFIDKKVTLDLNGKKIEYKGATTLSSGILLVHNGAELTVNGEGSIIGGDKAYAAIALTKSGDDASKPAVVTVNGGNITGKYYAVVGNGSRHNTQITINGGNLTSLEGAAIYHPQEGTLVVNGGTLTGAETAIEQRAGSLKVTGGTLTATATEFKCNPNGSGTTTIGAAVAIAQHTTKKDIKVEITGGTFNGVKAINESNPQENDPAPQVEMAITAGTFNGAVSTVDIENFISGGKYKFDLPSKYLAPGFSTVPNGDGTYGVEAKSVASIGTKLYTSLADAFAEATDDQTIKLLEDVELTEQIEIADKNVILLLNGRTIEYTGPTLSSGVLLVHNGAGLTVNGEGSIIGGKAYGGIALTKKNDDASKPAVLTVNGGNISGFYYAIVGNGSRHNTKITINGGNLSVTGDDGGTAIYHPQDGSLIVNGGTLTGTDTAIELRAGSLTINGGSFTATKSPDQIKPNGNGTTTEGAAIAVIQHTTQKPIDVAIKGGTFTGYKAFVEANAQNNPAEAIAKIKLAITGGTFNGDVESQDVKNFISGGVYDKQFAEDLCAVGFQLVPNSNNTFGVEPKDAVASIGSKLYYTLQEAVNAATEGQTVKLLVNVVENITVAAGKKIVLDLNDCVLNGKQTANTCTILNEGTLTLKNGTVKRSAEGSSSYYIIENRGTLNMNATVEGSASASLIRNNAAAAVMNITDGTYTQTGAFVVLKNDLGEVNVTGGKFSTQADKAVLNNWDKMTIKGGEFTGQILNGAYDTEGNVLTIEDGKFNTSKIRTYLGNGKNEAPIIIKGGFFLDPTLQFTGEGTANVSQAEVSGGTFANPVPAEVCAEHYEPMKRPDGTYGVKIQDPVASIGTDFYFTLQEAVTAATAGQTVKLLADVTENIVVLSTQSLTLDLNGKTITEDAANNTQDCVISNAGKLTIKGNGTVKDAPSTKCKSLVLTTKEMVIENGTFVRDNFTGDYYYVVMADGSGAKLTIKAGTFEANNGGKRSRNVLGQNGATVVIDGGKYTLPTTSALTHVNVHSFNGANVTINGGEFSAPATGSKNLYAKRNATLTVKGGKFISADDESLLGTEETVNVTLYGGTYNNDINTNFADYIPEKYECVESETQGWWIIREIPVPTKLVVYVGDHDPLILEASKEEMAEEWAKTLTLYPNATAVVDKNFATWAKEQTNIIYPGQYGEYECQNLSLTDLSNEGYGTPTMAASTAFYAPVQEFKAVKMTYKRTLNNGWNSLALPFSFTPEAKNTASKFYFTKVLVDPVLNGDVVEFDEQALTTQVEAGTPVFVHSTGGEVDFSSENVMIVTKAKNVNGMIGTFDFTEEYAGNYAPVSTADCLAPLADYLFPFRACINVPSTAKSLRFTYNGVSGINDIIFNEAEANDIFNVSGMKVSNANKSGIYIINGKKVLKK